MVPIKDEIHRGNSLILLVSLLNVAFDGSMLIFLYKHRGKFMRLLDRVAMSSVHTSQAVVAPDTR
jgi:hypothetical protein